MADAESLVPGTARGQRSPTVETVIVILGVFLVQFPLSLLGLTGLTSLLVVADPTLFAKPWTLLTATYAHAGPGHLLGNLVPLVLFGFVVERVTSRLRYHAFFVLTGAVAAVAEITLGGLLALEFRGVLGASGGRPPRRPPDRPVCRPREAAPRASELTPRVNRSRPSTHLRPRPAERVRILTLTTFLCDTP